MGTLAAGIKEIFATAKTTGSNVMLCGNDGTPDGHMTMANLASVLGVPTNLQRLSSGADLNDYTQQGIWYLDIGIVTGIANVPPSFYYGVVVSITAANQTMQYAADADGFWCRRADSGSFSRWLRCDNFGYNTLSDLANALGVANDSFQVKKMVASTVGMSGINIPLKVEGDNHAGSIAILNNLSNGGFGISFRINGTEVGWLGYEVSDGKLHWNSASSGSHVIA